MPGRFSRRERLRMAANSAANPALAAPPVQTQAPDQLGASQPQPGIEPNTIKRRGTGFRGYDPERAFHGSRFLHHSPTPVARCISSTFRGTSSTPGRCPTLEFTAT